MRFTHFGKTWIIAELHIDKLHFPDVNIFLFSHRFVFIHYAEIVMYTAHVRYRLFSWKLSSQWAMAHLRQNGTMAIDSRIEFTHVLVSVDTFTSDISYQI